MKDRIEKAGDQAQSSYPHDKNNGLYLQIGPLPRRIFSGLY